MNRLDPIGRREFLALLAAAGSFAADKISTPLLTRAEKEQFLRDAKIIKTKGVSQGITGTVRATMSDGKLTHDASIQVIDEYKQQFQTAMGTELNFKDSWKFNLAAYKLDRLLGLNMVPVTVERRFRNQLGSSTWWVDDVLMTELTRYNKKVAPPDDDAWNKQIFIVRVFDQLIHNMDRNLGNLVIDNNWLVWMIDHTRAFRMSTDLKEPKNLARCDKEFLARMKQLDAATLSREFGGYTNNMEIQGLLKRRDKIVETFERMGPSALYSSPRRPD